MDSVSPRPLAITQKPNCLHNSTIEPWRRMLRTVVRRARARTRARGLQVSFSYAGGIDLGRHR
jgi:hypothetical protein